MAQLVKNLLAMLETWVQSWVGNFTEEGHGNPLQYSCLENPHGQRSLVGYSLWGHKESDRTERLSSERSTLTTLFLREHLLKFSLFSYYYYLQWSYLLYALSQTPITRMEKQEKKTCLVTYSIHKNL